MSKKAILYTRVSTDEQAVRGYSLRDQFEKLNTYCTINGIVPLYHFQEDHSAKSFERPEFKKLLDFIKSSKNTVDLLLFIKWDRFSRNATESYEMLKILKKFNVEAQAIEQPLNLDVPENKLMLALFLASPEVENDRRSLNTMHGMRRAIREGRWCVKAPKGYVNKRDENNKPIIVPNNDAKFIKQAFEEFSSGLFTLETIRKKLQDLGFICSKSNFATLMRNPVYIGKIRLRETKEEVASLVKGLHTPIISEQTFNVVQDILDGKKNGLHTANIQSKKPELPLRGFLICPRCGKILTGSASKGRKTRYFYYHCSYGCKERVRANIVNSSFISLLKKFQTSEEEKELYNLILKELLVESESNRQSDVESVNAEIKKVQIRIESLQDKFADNEIEISDYKSTRQRYERQLKILQQNKADSLSIGKDEYDRLVFCFSFLKDLPSIYLDATIDVQQRIIGSIFPEKLIFSENNYRTARLNSVVELITNINRPFGRKKNGQFCKKTKLSVQVPEAGIEPARV